MAMWLRNAGLGVLLAFAASMAFAQALADGFEKLPTGAKIVLMPMDVELYSMSAGGVLEPQAEWTAQALSNLESAFQAKKAALGVEMLRLGSEPDEVVDELNRLHGVVGAAISIHHFGPYKLPTKAGRFDWTLGEGVDAIRNKTGADYALFTFVRDSYASSGRVAAMVVGALFGFGLTGGFQVGYASLVDLHDGRVVWFNMLRRGTGDLRTPEKATETLDTLLEDFPG